MKRNTYLFILALVLVQSIAARDKSFNHGKRVVIVMMDGFGMSYFNNAPMPWLKSKLATSFVKEVNALMPTVTNANSTSICTGTFPEVNGISGNFFLNDHGQEEYMEDKKLVLAPTLFQKLNAYNIHSALISSKKKSTTLLSAGADIVVSPETADSTWINRIGQPPSIYSAEVNYWSFRAGIYLLQNRKDIGCIYIHTTDYPMHTWSPADSNSITHLQMIDRLLQQISETAPDATILITADHDVNHKSRCVDIQKALKLQGIEIKLALSPEKDKYIKHHRGFGGASYVYLDHQNDQATVIAGIKKINGIEKVLTRKEAVEKYHLPTDRIGDIMILADSTTVFGDLENQAEEALPATYRSHGSAYELKVPVIILNATHIPPASYFNYNKDLAAWLTDRQ